MLNNPSPLPLNADAVTLVLTTNPKFGEIDAVAEPLAIRDESPVKDENGISNKPLPLPLNIEAVTVDLNIPEPVTIKKLLTVNAVLTNIPLSGATDAVAEPEKIKLTSKLEIAERGILNNLSPLPE